MDKEEKPPADQDGVLGTGHQHPVASDSPEGYHHHHQGQMMEGGGGQFHKMVEADDEVGGGANSQPGPIAAIEVDKPTVEQLLEENKQLKATAAEALGRMEEVKKENRKLREWKGMKVELAGLVKEEELLVERVDTLKKTLGLGTHSLGSKLEEIRKLTMKVNELKAGKVRIKKPIISAEVIRKGMEMPGRKDAVTIFPEEVWQLIFGNVSDSNDLWNLCNTCQLFDIILSQWKTGWMLKQALPHLYRHLPGNKLLESRLVCKSWKETVDHFLEDHPSLRPHDSENHEPRRLDLVNPIKETRVGEDYVFYMDNNIFHMSKFDDPIFIEKWKQIQILGRDLSLTLGGADYGGPAIKDEDYLDEETGKSGVVKHTFEQMWDKFTGLLNCFGTEVRYLNVQFISSKVDRDKWEQKIRQFLTADLFRIFPNLRRLCVGYMGLTLTFEEAIDSPLPLPPLAPNLETFESNCWAGSITIGMLIRHSGQLRSLLCAAGSWETVNPLIWPNLTELHLYGFEADENFANLFDGPGLPQLRKLGLNLGDLIDNNAREFRSLLTAIRWLSDRTPLDTLRLEGGLRGFHAGQFRGSSYALSKVKTLEFDHYTEGDSAPTYDFLLTFFPLLENLTVFVRKDFQHDSFARDVRMGLLPRSECEEIKKPLGSGKEQEIVEVNKYMYDGQMYKSNIWELMPLLKVFSFQWDVYTRHEYEACKEKLNQPE